MEKFKQKKIIALLSIIALFLMVISISLLGKTNDKYRGLVKVNNASIESKLLGSVGDATLEDNTVNGNSTIEYIVSFTLDEIEGVEKRDATIKASLTNEEFKYARFKAITGSNIESTLEENGKEIEVLVKNVRLGQEKTIKLKLVIENAPNTVEIHPTIKVSESTGSYTNIETDTVRVETNSLEGQVRDNNNLPVSNVEVVVRQNGIAIKKAYTNEEGRYVITDLQIGTYELDIDEDIYEAQKVTVEVNGKTESDLKVREVEPYKIETHKYIEKLKLVVDGQEKNYTYNDAEEVLETIRKANSISGEIEYKLVVKNIGDKSGTINQVKDEASEGLKLKEGNYGWEEREGNYYYRPLEGVTLSKNETREVGLVLEIESTSAAKTYINKMITKGEIYEKVVYILDGEIYKEEEVLEGEKIEEPIIGEDFSGWYTDRNRSNKYNFNLPVEKDLILYGITEETKFNVNYIVDGEIYESVVVDKGDTAEDIEAPEKEGKTFKYWSLDEDGEEYNFNTPITYDTDLYGVYEVNKYTVTFINEGTQYGEIQIVNYDGKATRPTEDPSKEYYRFKYWKLENGDNAYDFNTPVRSNITLYSEYERIQYNVKFIDEGVVIREGLVNAGSIIEPVAPTGKEGYTFSHWSEEPNGSNYNFNNPIIKDTTLYSVYNINHYNVDFYDEDNKVKTVVVSYNTTVSNEDAPEVTKEGHTFTYWSLHGETNAYDFNTPVTHDIRLDSNYTINKNEVIFNDENRITEVEVTWGETVNPISDQGKRGYTFSHWSEEPNGLAFDFNTPIKEAKILYAVYNINTYTIHYNLDGGTVTGNPESYNVKTPTFTLNNPTKEGYTFIGWTGTELSEKTNQVTIEEGSIGDREYTANFEINKFTVTFIDEGTQYGEIQTVNWHELAVQPTDPSKEGYTFKYWHKEGVTSAYDFNTPVEENITLYSYYEINRYTVTFIDEGTQYGEIQTLNWHELAVQPTDPSKEGHTFKYWHKEGATSAYNFSTPVEENIILYSYYEINKYTVTFINGETQFAQQQVNYNEVATEPVNKPAKANSIFLKWTLNGEAYDFSTKVKNDIVLYSSFETVEPPTITHVPTEWTKNNVTVTITSEHQDYQYYYRLSSESSNHLYEGPFEVVENCTVYAYSVKQEVNSIEVDHVIDNIDKINPDIIEYESTTATPNSITVNIKGQDNESGLRKYRIYVMNSGVYELIYEREDYDPIDTEVKEENYEITGLEQNTEYRIKIELEDRVGNISEDEITVQTTEYHYVARIIGISNTPLDEEAYLYFTTLKGAIEYEDCVSNQCTIQMIDNVEENNNVLQGQDITLDLNGYVVSSLVEGNTLTNSGELTIVDNGSSAGEIYSPNGVGIYSTGTLTIGVNEMPQSVSKTVPTIEGEAYGIVSTSSRGAILNFYDGRIIGNISVQGNINDTPYLYNTTVGDGVHHDENKQVETLTILADAEAKNVNTSTYYTKVQSGVDDSKNGTYEDVDYTKPLIQQLRSDSEHRFIYDESTGKVFNSNNNIYRDANPNIENTFAHSYLKLDLTNYENPQLITINAETNQFSGNEESTAYIYVTEDVNMPDLSSTEGRIMAVTGSKAAKDYTRNLDNGKEYYLHFIYNKKRFATGYGGYNNYDETFTINDINIGDYKVTYLSDLTNATLLHDTQSYFEKQQDGSYKTNGYSEYADSYMVIDLTNVDEQKYLLVDGSSYLNNDSRMKFYANVSDNAEIAAYNDPSNIIICSYGSTPRKTVSIKLKPNQVNFVHFTAWAVNGTNYYAQLYEIRNAEDNITASSDGIMHNKEDYYFEEKDYNPLIWKDLSGNNNDVTIVGATINSTEDGFIFDGNDYLEKNGGIVDYSLNSETVEVEFSTTTTGNQVYYIGNSYQNIGIGTWNGYVIVSNQSNVETYDIPDNLADGNRHRITITYDSDGYNAYFDGTAMTKRTDQNAWGGTNTITYIGRRSNGNYFTGTIYTVKVFNRELSDSEITGTSSNEGLLLYLDASNYKKTGKYYVSNNKDVSNSVANSYMVFDMTNVSTDRTLTINASVSCENGYSPPDVGYITLKAYDPGSVPETPVIPSYSDTSGRYVYVNGVSTNNYNISLAHGKINYVYFGYYKNGYTGNPNSDMFVINSMNYITETNETIPVYNNNSEDDVNIKTITYQTPVINENPDTVQIIRNITLTSPLEISETRNMVLDLNGYTLTTSKNDYVIKNNGSLKVIDSDYINQPIAAQEKYNREMREYNEQLQRYEEYISSATYVIDNNYEYVYDYTGSEQVFIAPVTGTYKIETWGAQGGTVDGKSGGLGAYASGEVLLQKNQKLYIYVGENYNGYKDEPSFNGGGKGNYSTNNDHNGNGGGATDIRLVNGEWNDFDSLKSRIMVAGAGGGSSNFGNKSSGGYGGTLIGGNGNNYRYSGGAEILVATGGTQTSGGLHAGDSSRTLDSTLSGKFGSGGYNETYSSSWIYNSGGGGGYYGGGAGGAVSSNVGSAAGGSSFISGYEGCDAIDVDSTEDNIIHTGQPIHYSNITFTDSDMKAGNEEMPTHDGTGTMTGNSGNGYARITPSTETIAKIDEKATTETVVPTNHPGEEPKLDTDYEMNGNVTSTTNSTILNNNDGYLDVESGLISVNKSGSYSAIVNRGYLTLGSDAIVNALQSSNRGIHNEQSGDILDGSGLIITSSTSNIGILNDGVNEEEIKGYTIQNSDSSSKSIYNRSINDLVLDNITSNGAGMDIYQESTKKLTINNSNLNSTSNESYYSNETGIASIVEFNNCNIKNRIYNRLNSARKIYINDSVMNGTRESNILAFSGYVEINNSDLTHTNWNLVSYATSKIVANDSIFHADNHSITTGTDGYFLSRDEWRYYIRGNTTLNNVDIYTKGTSDTYVIYNYDQTTINGGSINNEKENCSLVYNGRNSYHDDDRYYDTVRPTLTITGDFTTDGNFTNGIYTLLSGDLIIGEDDGEVSSEYPLIKAKNSVINNQAWTNFKFYDGNLVGKVNSSINGQINEIPDGYDLHVDKTDEIETNYLVANDDSLSEDYYVARIGNTKYTTLQGAFDAVPSNNTETEVVLLKDLENASTSIVDENKNIVLNMDNHNIKGYNSSNFIINNGKIKFTNSELNDTHIVGYGSTLIKNNNEMIIDKVKIYQLRNYMSLIENNNELTINDSEIYTTLGYSIGISTTYYSKSTNSTHLINNNGNLEINDSNLHTYETMVITSSGDVTVNDSIFAMSSGSGGPDVSVFIDNTSTEAVVTLNNVNSTFNYGSSNGRAYKNAGTIYSNGGKASISGYCGNSCWPSYFLINKTNANAYIDGTEFADTHGRIMSNGGYAEITNVISKAEHGLENSGTLKIEDSELTYLHQNAVSNSGDLTIKNSTLEGTTTLLSSSGILNVDNSTIYNTYFHSSDMYNTHQAVNLSGSGDSTISNSTITGNYGIVSSNSGTTNLTNNTITGNARNAIEYSGSGTLNVISGTVTGTNNGIYNSGTGIINIGTKGAPVSKVEPHIEANSYALNNGNANATINFYDGLLIANTAIAGSLAEVEPGYSIILTKEDEKEHKYLDRVYTVENTRTHEKYYTIQEGIDASSNGDILEVLREVTTSSAESTIIVSSSKNVTIDTKGYKLIIGNEKFIENNGTLTITSSATEINEETGETTIIKGYIESAGSNIIDNKGTVTLSNIEIKKVLNNATDIVLNSGTMNTNNIKVHTSIDGMSSWLINNTGTLNSTNSVYSTYNSKAIYNEGSIDSLNDEIVMTITQIDARYLKSILIKNTSGAQITFDGLEFKHASTYSNPYDEGSGIVNDGELIIQNSEMTATGGRDYYVDSRPSIIIYNKENAITEISNTIFKGPYGIIAYNYGTLTIDDCNSTLDSGVYNFSSGTSTITDSIFSGISRYAFSNEGIMDITDSEIDTTGTAITNSKKLSLSNVLLNSSSTSTGTQVLSNSGSDVVTISGTTSITGPIGINSTGTGSIDINSVTITSSNYGINNSGAGSINIIEGTITSSNVGINNTGASHIVLGVQTDGTVSITNPSITGNNIALNNTVSSSIVDFYDGILIGNTALVGSISNIEPNYEIITKSVDGKENKYLAKEYVVENTRDHEKYYTIQEGINSSQSGDTLVLLRNLTVLPNDVTVTVDNTKEFTLDLAGFTITTNNALFIDNAGDLTITDSTKTSSTVGDGGITSNISQLFNNTGTLTFEGGTYLKTIDYTKKMIVNTGKVVINDGKFTISSSDYKPTLDATVALIENDNELEINGGEVSVYLTKAIENNGTFNMTGGNINKYATSTIVNNENGATTSYKCELIINSASSEINISNGTISDIGEYYSIYNNGLVKITNGIFDLKGETLWHSGAYYYYFVTTGLVYNNTNASLEITGGTFDDRHAMLTSNDGTAVIRNITSDYVRVAINSGTLTLDNVIAENIAANPNPYLNRTGIINSGDLTITGGSYKGAVDMLSNSGDISIDGTSFDGANVISLSGTGTNTIANSTITSSGTAIAISGSTTSVTDTSITASTILSSSGGTIDFTNITANATSTLISNTGSGTINLNSGTYETSSGNVINSTSSGTINVKSGTYKTANGHGINNSGSGTINIGESGGIPDITDPVIQGRGTDYYGLNNTSGQAKVYFYDGIINGQKGSVYGLITDVEPGYKEKREASTIDDLNYTSSTLTIIGEDETVAVVNNTNFTGLQSAVNYAVANEIPVIRLVRAYTLDANLVKPAGINVTIYTNGNTLNTGDYTIDSGITIDNGQAPSGLGGALYRLYANITGTEINPKNIIIYKMEDGTSLKANISYKLFKLEDGSYNIIKFSEESIGEYNKDGSEEKLYTVKGRLYLNGLGQGNYKLVGSDNKEIDFEIGDNSVSNNIRISDKVNHSRVTTSVATLILTFSTGILRSHYILLVLLLTIILLTLLAIRKTRKELE